jgi:Zn-dependent peptidase ImmA (M78 family)/DNA-binding XRE family transcriptional regulator
MELSEKNIVNSETKININSSMIILGRESRGINQKDLAEKLGLSQGTLSKIEMGLLPVSKEVLNGLSKELHYPPSFFSMEMEIYRGVSLHRKRLTLAQKKLNQIDAWSNIVRLHIHKLTEAIEINVNLPHIDENEIRTQSPNIVAQSLRAFWKVPKGTIKNMSALLEKNGIIVVPIDFGTKLIDGLSISFVDIPPIILINKNIPGDRYRFTLAHELGHLLLHTYPTETMEEEANLFASEFLTPEIEIKPYLDYPSIERLIELKRYWKVSIASLLVRAMQLNNITDRQYRYMWMKISKLGYKTKEPIDIPIEEPILLKQLFDYHIDQLEYNYKELAEFFSLFQDELVTNYLGYRKETTAHLSLVE